MSGEVWGIAMVKDEADIIGRTAGHMLEQVDRLLIADNGSTDGTLDVLTDLARASGDRVRIVSDNEPGYYQSKKMTHLAWLAGEDGAAWVVPFDADEWWTAKNVGWGTISDVLRALPPVEGIATADLFDHVTTDVDDLTNPDPIGRIQWRRAKPAALPKVACRPVSNVVILQGNHGAQYPGETPHRVLEIRHFPYRSDSQFVRKVRNGSFAYAATDLPDYEGAHWRQYGSILRSSGEEVLVDEVYRRWFHQPDVTVPDPGGELLVHDPAR